MHHMIPNSCIYPSGDFYSWPFAPDHRGNRTTKLCLGRYLSYSTLYDSVKKTSKSYSLDVAYCQLIALTPNHAGVPSPVDS